LSVTVPTDGSPGFSVDGLSVSLTSAVCGMTVSCDETVVPLHGALAVIVTVVGADTLLVLMVNEPAVKFGVRLILDGTDATAGLLLDRFTDDPLEGTRPFRMAVPVTLLPPPIRWAAPQVLIA